MEMMMSEMRRGGNKVTTAGRNVHEREEDLCRVQRKEVGFKTALRGGN
jgi:hypothetical protein